MAEPFCLCVGCAEPQETLCLLPMPHPTFTEIEERILALAGGDLPDGPEPFNDIARAVGCTQKEVLDLLVRLKSEGIIRRFGATLRHQKAGYGHNAMVAWVVPAQRSDEVAEIMMAHPEISHICRRRTYPDWPYNFYSMIHGRDPEAVDRMVKELERATGITEHATLASLKELKKTSMHYF